MKVMSKLSYYNLLTIALRASINMTHKKKKKKFSYLPFDHSHTKVLTKLHDCIQTNQNCPQNGVITPHQHIYIILNTY